MMNYRRFAYLAAALLLMAVLSACGADTGTKFESTWDTATWDESVWQ
jgi:hypothetical protein